MNLAELIVRTLDLSLSGNCEESDIDSEQLTYADEIKHLYSAYKSHLDFSSAARKARIEVVEKIIYSHSGIS